MGSPAWAAGPGEDGHRSGGVHPGPAGPTDQQCLDAYDLVAVKNYSHRQVAAALNVPQVTATRWITRGRKLYWEGEATGRERRRQERQDATAWYRAQLLDIALDVEHKRIDRAEGYKLALAYRDRIVRLWGADAPRRLAARGKVTGEAAFALDADVAAQLAALDPHELTDPANEQEDSP